MADKKTQPENVKETNAGTPEAKSASADAATLPLRNSRPQRRRIGLNRPVELPLRPGYRRALVNDTPGNLQKYLNAGYAVVKDDLEDDTMGAGDGSPMGAHATRPVGGGINGILVEIPEEYWKEDRNAEEAERISMEEDMRRAELAKPGRYGEMDFGDPNDKVRAARELLRDAK